MCEIFGLKYVLVLILKSYFRYTNIYLFVFRQYGNDYEDNRSSC
jgi:hypothetical protein